MIPDEAVEAGAAAIQVRLDKNVGLNDLTRAVLEAAAPHMLVPVFDEGADIGRKYPVDAKARNPYRSQA